MDFKTNLEQSDPEFFKFLLKEQPNLLEFDDGLSDLGSEDEQEDLHQAPDKLMNDSDDDDEEEELNETQMSKKTQLIVDNKLIKRWKELLSKGENSSIKTLKEVLQAFHACLVRIDRGGNDENVKKNKKTKKSSNKYKIITREVFTSLIDLCMSVVPKALDNCLGYNSKIMNLKINEKKQKKGKIPPSSSKRWSQIVNVLRFYLDDVMTMLLAMNNSEGTFLIHIKHMMPYYICLPKICKKLCELLINRWSKTDLPENRLRSFICLEKLLELDQKRWLEKVLKQCYIKYVENSHKTSISTLPKINFMQQTYAIFCEINTEVTYTLGYFFIRRMALELYKAISDTNKETRSKVYSWKYVHMIGIWCHVLSTPILSQNTTLRSLVYPLVMISQGTIDLVSAARYYPLRFHIVRKLISLASTTNFYIPLDYFILHPLLSNEFKKKQLTATGTLKRLNFDIMLKLSESQLKSKAYVDSTMDQVYDLLMNYLNTKAHTIDFPEMTFGMLYTLKKYIKSSKATEYRNMMRRIVQKIKENKNFIIDKRSSVQDVTDASIVDLWEAKMKREGVPFHKHHEKYTKLRIRENLQQIADEDRVLDEKLPKIEREKFVTDEIQQQDRNEFNKAFEDAMNATDDQQNYDADFENAINKKGNPEKMKKKKNAEEEEEESENDEENSDGDDDYSDSDIPLTSDDDSEVSENESSSDKKTVKSIKRKVTSLNKQPKKNPKVKLNKKDCVRTISDAEVKKLKKQEDVVQEFNIDDF